MNQEMFNLYKCTVVDTYTFTDSNFLHFRYYSLVGIVWFGLVSLGTAWFFLSYTDGFDNTSTNSSFHLTLYKQRFYDVTIFYIFLPIFQYIWPRMIPLIIFINRSTKLNLRKQADSKLNEMYY